MECDIEPLGAGWGKDQLRNYPYASGCFRRKLTILQDRADWIRNELWDQDESIDILKVRAPLGNLNLRARRFAPTKAAP
jgi:hypothetical protein